MKILLVEWFITACCSMSGASAIPLPSVWKSHLDSTGPHACPASI
jgi:hypothetical protein